jgi:beta-aspartyl-peptidase (threonine type)
MRKSLALALLAVLAFFAVAFAQNSLPAGGTGGKADIILKRADAPRWAIAIHGGAGVIPKTLPAAEKEQYFKSLDAALKLGRDVLAGGGTSLDAVEKVVRFLEDDPLFNAGKGAVYTHDGKHELDAAIMSGRDLACGSVAELTTVKNPISLARLVMEKSQHVFLVGQGAERFADEMKVPRVPNSWFDTEYRLKQWQDELKSARGEGGAGDPDKKHGTVGAVALDVQGDLAAATSTGGLTDKRFGRVGDVPIVGAGTYANNATCAISATGVGEQFIRHTVSHDISALMEYRGLTLQQAADLVIHKKLNPGDGGVIGVAHDGSIALVFNSEGMFRGAADSGGRFEVKIWE